LLSCLVFGVIAQAPLQSAKAQIKYTITRLVPISGVSSNPTGLNAQGDVVGTYIRIYHPVHVFLNHAGVMHDIPDLVGTYSLGINIYGRIIGYNLNNDPNAGGRYTYFEKKAWSLSRTTVLIPVAVNTAGRDSASPKAPSRRVRYDRAQLIPEVRTPARITPYPTGRYFSR
jgi:hypothetical protein